MPSMIQDWYKRHKKLCWVIAGLFLFYSLVGFVGAPMMIHHVLENKVSEALNRKVSAEKVRVNPYTLSVRMVGLSVVDRDGGPFVSAGDIYVNVDPLVSLFKWGVAVKSIGIQNLKVRVVRTASDQFNFSDLLKSSDKTTPDAQKTESKPLRLLVKDFKLLESEFQFYDKSLSQPFESTVSAINVSLNSLDTKPEAASALYRFNAKTESGESVHINGQIDVNPLTIATVLKLESILISKYAPYYNAFLNGKVTGGKIGLEAKVDWADEVQTVKDFNFSLSELALVSNQDEALLALPEFQVAGAGADLLKQEIQLGRVTARDGEIDVKFSKEGLLNLSEAFTPSTGKKAPPSELDAPKNQAGGQAWIINIPEFSLENYKVRYVDQQVDPAANFTVHQIRMDAKALSTRKDTTGTAALSLKWAEKGAVSLQGNAGLIPLQADMRLKVDDLDIRPIQPYIFQHAQLVVTNGLLSAEGLFKMVPKGSGLDIQYAGQGALSQFKSVDQKKTEGFLDWKSLYLSDLNLGTSPFRLTINEVSLTDFYKRMIIHADGSSNIGAILVKRKDAAGDVANAKDAKPDTEKQADKTPAPKIQINTVTLQGGKVDFSDLSVKPNVRLPMTQIGGRVSGLDAIKEHKADVLLKGMVNGTVPMEIKGKVNPLIEKPFVDLTIGLRGVDLSPFTPYSGKYLGHKLEKGQLTLDLAYRVADNKLAAKNKVRLNQLTLGQSVSSPDATKLPIKLAIALLKDRNGNIDIDLPISGNLDDPDFSIGGIVMKMFVNLIVSIVSSPFKMLGAIFGGGEELAYFDFEAGQGVIPDEKAEKLDTMAKILYERPGLRLEIQGQVNPKNDIDGLRRLRFEDQLKAAKLKTMISRGKKAVPLEKIQLNVEERNKLVQRAYGAAKFPKPRDERGKLKKLSFPEMEKLLYTAIQITKDDLRLLAHQRASVVKKYLIDQGKVEVERLFIIEPNVDATADSKEKSQSRVKFNLK